MESWPKFIILIFAQYTFHFYQIFKKFETARIKETMKEYDFILMGQSNIQLTLCRHFLLIDCQNIYSFVEKQLDYIFLYNCVSYIKKSF